MKTLWICTCLLFGIALGANSQINYTANDQVPEYSGHFRFGANMGAYSNWSDDDLANIAAGNPALGLKGAGVRSLRPTLPEYFLENWAYDIRVNTFQHYASLDVQDNTVFIGFPSAAHQDPEQYCPNIQSTLFANMYTDIWDGGANGTPVNEDNYYALYLYKMVSLYKEQVKFWEVWNEPDFDFSANGWKPRGLEGNWFENVPEPCDYSLRAPVFHYIRLLRISYEVIKYVDPTAYVAVGGLGFPSFLDLILRHSDNPDAGKIAAEFPLKGGAYFDVLSYHSYPHFDGSLRYWSNDVGGFVHTRHSDAAMQGVLNKKTEFQEVLEEYQYDGNTFPEKLWIITESNIPRKTFGDYIGSAEAQRNFLIKTLVGCQQKGIEQYHLYTMADSEIEANASNEFQVMGLFKKLEGIAPYQQTPNPVAIAGRSVQQLIYKKTYDPLQSAKLELPETIDGGAFRDNTNGQFTYVLWAKTETDRSEEANASYSFPASLGITDVERKEWNYGQTSSSSFHSANNISLTGSPAFFTATSGPTSGNTVHSSMPGLKISPNPGSDWINLQFHLATTQEIRIVLYDSKGQSMDTPVVHKKYAAGDQQIQMVTNELASGIYWIHLLSPEKNQIVRWVKW